MSAPYITIKQSNQARNSTAMRTAAPGYGPSRVGAATKAAPRVAARRRALGFESVLTNVALFCAVAPLTWGFSLLLGHSLKENARRQAVHATQRASVARQDMARLRNRLDRLTSSNVVDAWAVNNGFVSSHSLGLEDVR